MGIDKISGSGFPQEPLRTKKTSEETKRGVPASEDKLEISDEALSLFQTREQKRLEAVRDKIRSGYYLQREVTEKVVDAILKDPEFDQAS